MADNSTRRQPQTIFAGGSNTVVNSNEAGGTSRLLIDSQGMRNVLESRNLYTPDVEYPLSPNSVQKVVNAISSIGSALAPFSGYQLKNSVIGRVASTIGGSSPLSEIGLVMLGKQFVMNSVSHLEQTYMPTMDLGGFLKGGKLFKKAVDYSITVKPQTGFKTLLQNLAGGNATYKNPFNFNPSNAEIIENTGTAQLNYLYTALNYNIYKEDDQTLIKYGNIAGTPILSRNIITNNQTFFNFDSDKEYPYLSYHPSVDAAVDADYNMKASYKSMGIEGQEYAPDADFIRDNFGTTDKTETNFAVKDSHNDWISTDTEFRNDDIKNKLVWGRDGLDPIAEKNLAQLRGDSDLAKGKITPESINNFKIKGGLLEYTRNLLNATEGNFVDFTKKAFKNGNELVGFNGSGLWRAPISGQRGSNYAVNSGNADKQGVRQHTVLDQYDKFAKAIRFNGNQVYGGNKDSVIYKSVLPRIHPTLDKDGKPDPRNLMFSIENLAIKVLSKDSYGIIDDEYGSPIPASEVGPFNGRIMWFPPYNLEINETGQAKFESTTIIGRNEPMYNYMNSERSTTLSFTLLVDYPQQLKNYMGQNKQKDIAEFFAFGGDPYTDNFISIENYQLKIAKLTTDIEKIKGKTVVAEPNKINPPIIDIVFPNDVPAENDNLSTIIDDLYRKYTYEIKEGLPSSDITSWGLNADVYFKTGVKDTGNVDGKQTYKLTGGSSQYSSVALTDQYGDNILNKMLFDVFNDKNNRISYSVYIYGAASRLYLTAGGKQYNKKLGERRAQAVQILIQKKLIAMFGESIAKGIEVTWSIVYGESVGDVYASDSNATIEKIPYKETKQERHAYIQILKNNRSLPRKKAVLNSTDTTNILKLQAEIEAAKTQIQKIKDNQSGIYKERGSDSDAILGGFKSVSDNYFYPVFHSQTPEDFHKRLTFLHQCQRQGAAKRWSSPVSGENSAMARNSVFGRQPICILRIGDFFYTKVIIENYTIDYSDTTWDMNPEGFGMQPMLAKVTLQMKLMGGQSLKGPIDALQNAVSFNYYANSTFTNAGMYKLPSRQADSQESFIKEILTTEQGQMNDKYNKIEETMNMIINNGLLLH